MDILGFFELPLWIPLFMFFLFLLYRYSISPFETWKNHGVKGPKPVPFIGNVHAIYSPNIGPRACFANWEAKYGRIFGIYFIRHPTLVVTDLEMLKQIFVKEFNNFFDRSLVGDRRTFNRIIRKGVFFDVGDDWQRVRRIMTPIFTSGKLKQLVYHVDRTAHHLSENFEEHAKNNTCLDAKEVFGAFALDTIAALAFGLDINSQDNFDLPFIKKAQSLLTFKTLNKVKVLLGGIFPALAPLFEYFDIGFFDSTSCNYFEKSIYSLISERKNDTDSNNPVDFLQLLLNAESEEATDSDVTDRKLSVTEVAAQSIIFIIAGYETTSTCLQYLCYELARNKTIQMKLYEEIQQIVGDDEELTYNHVKDLRYMSLVISETLRMYPPVHLITREAHKACIINGVSIPANAAIMVPLYNIGRDPMYFEEPNVFRPERFEKKEIHTLNDVSFLPFGFGPRHCLGMRFALMEIKLAIARILQKVIINDATPKVLEIEDFSGLLVPKIPIKLYTQLR